MHYSTKYLFAFCFPTKNLYTFLFSPIRATSPFRLIPRDYLKMIFVEDRVSWRFSLCYLFHSLVTSYLLRPNVFSNTLFCNTKNLCTSLSVKDQDPQPYKQRENCIDWTTVKGSGTSCQWLSCTLVKTAWGQHNRENQFDVSRWRDHEVITLVVVRRPVCALYYICDVWIVLWEGNAPSGVATTCEHLAAASGIDTSISLWSFGRNNHHIM